VGQKAFAILLPGLITLFGLGLLYSAWADPNAGIVYGIPAGLLFTGFGIYLGVQLWRSG